MEYFRLNQSEISAFLHARRTAGPDHCLAVGANRFDEPLTERQSVAGVVREKCEMCPLHFTGKARMWRHVRASHDRTENRLVCSMPRCRRKFVALSAAFAHWTHHQADGPSARDAGRRRRFKRADTCELCGRLFWDRHALLRHMATRHPDSRDGTCDTCGRYMGNGHAVRKHSAVEHGGACSGFRSRRADSQRLHRILRPRQWRYPISRFSRTFASHSYF